MLQDKIDHLNQEIANLHQQLQEKAASSSSAALACGMFSKQQVSSYFSEHIFLRSSISPKSV